MDKYIGKNGLFPDYPQLSQSKIWSNMSVLPCFCFSLVSHEYVEVCRPSTPPLELCLDLYGNSCGNVLDNAECPVLCENVEACGLSVPPLELCLDLCGNSCGNVLDNAKYPVSCKDVEVCGLSVLPLELCLDLYGSPHGDSLDNVECTATSRSQGSFNWYWKKDKFTLEWKNLAKFEMWR